MNKKYLSIAIAVIAVLGVGFFLAGYILTRKGTPEDISAPVNPFNEYSPFGKTPDEIQAGKDTGGGNGSVNTQNPDGSSGQAGGSSGKQQEKTLRQISKGPVAGFNTYIKSGKEYVEYVESQTGNVFETKLETIIPNRVSNSVYPRIQEAHIANGGKIAILRFVDSETDDIVSLVLGIQNTQTTKTTVTVKTGTTTAPIAKVSYLPKNISDMIISKSGDSVFFLTKTDDFESRKTTGSTYDFKTGKTAVIFQSDFSEWLPVAYNGNIVYLQTKASKDVPGYLYSLDVTNGKFQHVFGDLKGFTAFPDLSGQKILYSESTRGLFMSRIYDINSGTSENVEISTLPEKCIWRKDNIAIYCAVPDSPASASYPDEWYQSAQSFNDFLYLVNIKTGEFNSMIEPKTAEGKNMDIMGIKLSNDENYLIFQNKKDLSLWAYTVSEIYK
jgi:hypothetical protein